MQKEKRKISKFLSYVLRHRPDEIGIVLDEHGWIEIDVLLAACGSHGKHITRDMLKEIVTTNNKQRFAISADGWLIRANQGHSVTIDLGLVLVEPPEYLYHGTVERFLASILADGLKKGNRHHVHLSKDVQTANKVGQRRGKPIILQVAAMEMAAKGHQFYKSENGVWLADAVPPKYLSRHSDEE